MTIKINSVKHSIDNAGLLSIVFNLVSDVALNNQSVGSLPIVKLDAYNDAAVKQGTTFTVDASNTLATAALNTNFDLTKTVSLLTWIATLPAETKLSVKVYTTFTNALPPFTFKIPVTGSYNNFNFFAVQGYLGKTAIISEEAVRSAWNPTDDYLGTSTTNVGNAGTGLTVETASNYINNIAVGYNQLTSIFKTNFSTYLIGTTPTTDATRPVIFVAPNNQIWKTSYNNATQVTGGTTAKFPLMVTEIPYEIGRFNLFSDIIIGTVNNKTFTNMDLTKPEFTEIARDVLSISETNSMRIEVLLLSLSHNDTANEKVIPLTNEAHQLCFIKKINVAIAADGTVFSLKINNKENAVTSTLQIVPEGIEGNYEAAGYFATELILKGNITGQVIYYRATKL